jgi:hypothetical protein
VGRDHPDFPYNGPKGHLFSYHAYILVDGMQLNLDGLLDTIKAKAKLWVAAGALGLVTLLPLA